MAARSQSKVSTRRKRRREPAWTRLTDAELLRTRFCDLRLTLRNSEIESQLREITRSLRARGIRFRPHVWLSEEWFSPDGVPGIAVPFYMAHPRLQRLERRFMGEVEGGNANWLTRILRHEIGHALDNAYRLRRRKEWRRTFGRASRPYPDIYRPRPASRDFVLHLGHWYAQSHPTEDFAETFAVWLQPRARWRREYQDLPALRKLEYVDKLMAHISGMRPIVRNEDVIEPLSDNTSTLGEHYRRKRGRYEFDKPDAYDLRLKRVFGKQSQGRQARAREHVPAPVSPAARAAAHAALAFVPVSRAPCAAHGHPSLPRTGSGARYLEAGGEARSVGSAGADSARHPQAGSRALHPMTINGECAV